MNAYYAYFSLDHMRKEFNYHSRVMGSDFDVTFVSDFVDSADRYYMEAMKIARFYEEKFSRFDPGSEISHVNVNKKAQISQDFEVVFNTAKDLYHKTDGIFNPLLQVSAMGYDRTFEKVTDVDDVDLFGYDADLSRVCVYNGSISLNRDQCLDFGGFLKGYVSQKIALSINSPYGMIINIGGDLYVKGRDHNDEKFTFEIDNPNNPNKNIALSIENMSLCTSGTYKRKWRVGEKSVHHILDHATKKSVETDVISASVVHKNGAVADAFATAAISMGSGAAREFLSAQKVDYVLICENDVTIR